MDAGADDNIRKPFDFSELLSRIRGLLRRGHETRPEVIRIADLVLTRASHSASRSGRSIVLTAREFAVLEFLIARKGCFVSPEEIARHAWEDEPDAVSSGIETCVRRLRNKIDDGCTHPLIKTLRREGYMFAAAAQPAPYGLP